MLVIPAIDLKDGKCVRLRQGRFNEVTTFSDDPVAMAAHWREQGARRLHVVDLDGAAAGVPMNEEIVQAIIAANPDLPVQVGGGIRDLETIAFYIEAGVRFVIIGTQAMRDSDFAESACRLYPGQVIIGIDALRSMVAVEGWLEVSALSTAALVMRFAGLGAAAIIYTDIARDGMMQGPDIESTANLAERSTIPMIASGGVSKLDDISRLREAAATCGGAGIAGVIVGRALYEGAFELGRAQALLDA